MKTTIVSLICILFYCNPSLAQDWDVALRINKKAEVVEGSKAKLINAIRQGCDVKIAWGWNNGEKSMEHISEPIWTAILNEEDVLFHIDPQVFGEVDWNSLIGSFEGKMEAILYELEQDTISSQ